MAEIDADITAVRDRLASKELKVMEVDRMIFENYDAGK
jgi:hypothetical protein